MIEINVTPKLVAAIVAVLRRHGVVGPPNERSRSLSDAKLGALAKARRALALKRRAARRAKKAKA